MSRTIFFLLSSCALCLGADTMTLKQDEKIVFYPAIAQRVPGKDAWRIGIQGLIYEPEKRGITLAVVREALDLKDIELPPAEEKIFNDRARLFLVDHERGKRIFVRIGEKVFAARKSKADGSFAGEFLLSSSEVRRWRDKDENGNWRLYYAAELPSSDTREFSGEVLLLEETGLSVISDIDDTIKITEVRDRKATLRNTFAREFRPVPGMADFYQRLAKERSATFHYISASPWQLYEPLADFVQANKFAAGTFSLKEFRWKNRTALSLFADPEKYKPTVIEPLLKQFPKRRFILIGDSGERDPEIYAALARKFPEQIERIYIRDVTHEAADSPRYQQTFRGLPGGLWKIFTRPEELELPTATPSR